MVTKEQVAEWLEHPITQLYKQILNRNIAYISDVASINIEECTMEEIAKNVVAIANYRRGVEDAMDFSTVFDLAEVVDD